MFAEFSLIQPRNDRYNESAFLYHAVRARQRILTNRVEYHINVLRNVFEFLFRVIDRYIGPKFFQQILIRGRCRGDHLCTARPGNLNGKAPDATSTTVNEN